MTKTKMTVAQFLTMKIDESGKTQREIATEVGYDAANVITMFKQGSTKLPLNTVGPIARALDVDPVFLLRLAFNEYFPETFEAVEHARDARHRRPPSTGRPSAHGRCRFAIMPRLVP